MECNCRKKGNRGSDSTVFPPTCLPVQDDGLARTWVHAWASIELSDKETDPDAEDPKQLALDPSPWVDCPDPRTRRTPRDGNRHAPRPRRCALHRSRRSVSRRGDRPSRWLRSADRPGLGADGGTCGAWSGKTLAAGGDRRQRIRSGPSLHSPAVARQRASRRRAAAARAAGGARDARRALRAQTSAAVREPFLRTASLSSLHPIWRDACGRHEPQA